MEPLKTLPAVVDPATASVYVALVTAGGALGSIALKAFLDGRRDGLRARIKDLEHERDKARRENAALRRKLERYQDATDRALPEFERLLSQLERRAPVSVPPARRAPASGLPWPLTGSRSPRRRSAGPIANRRDRP